MYEILKEYDEKLKSCGLTKNTVEAYLTDVKAFIVYCESNDISAKRISSRVINEYLIKLYNDGHSESKINRIIASIKSLSTLLNKNYKIKSPIKNTSNENKIILINSDDIVKLLTIIDNNTTKGHRDSAIIQLLYATGIKASELMELNVNSVDFKLKALRITGDNSRIIPIFDDALDTLNTYVNTVRSKIVKDGSNFLFTNLNGSKLTRQGIWKIVSFYAEKSGVIDATPNNIRNSFAVHMIENGADNRLVKEMLGYKKDSSVKPYIDYLKNKYSNEYLSFAKTKQKDGRGK